MADKKKNLDTPDLMDFNDFDFGDDDFGFNSPKIPDNRTPTHKILGSFKKGTTEKLKDKDFQKNILKKALPKEYELGFDAYDEITYNLDELQTGIKRGLKPGLKELRDYSRKIFPGRTPLIPEKLYSKYNDWLDEKEYRQKSQNEVDQDSVALMLSDVFANQSKIQEAERQEDTVREELKSVSEKKRFEFSYIESLRTNSLLTSIVNYQDRVTTSINRKSLELQFKSYITQVRLLEAVKTTGDKTNAALEAITKNTALPEFVKIRNTEALKEITRRNIIQSALNSGPMNKISNLSKRLLSNFTKNAISGFRDAGEAASSFTSTLGMGSDFEDDQPKKPKTWKEVVASAGEKGAQYILPEILGHYVGKGSDKIRSKMGNGNPILNKISRGGKYLDYYLNGADQHLQNRVKEGGYGVLDSILDIAEADKEVFRSSANLSRMQYGVDRLNPGLGNTGVNVATEEVIPNWLQRIWGEIFMLRTGESKVENEVYDQRHKKFVKSSTVKTEIIDTLKQGYNKDSIDNLVEKVIKGLVGSKTLSRGARRVLANKIRLDAIEGNTTTPERYRYLPGIDPKLSKEIRKAIEDNFSYDPLEDTLKTTEGDALDKRRDIFSSTRMLMGQFSNVQQTSLNLMDEGKLGPLRDLGLVKEDANGLSLNYSKYLDLMSDGTVPGDPKVKGTNKKQKGQESPNDIFVKGESEPRIYYNLLKTGEYRDGKTLKVITSVREFKNSIIDSNNDIVLSNNDLKSGIYDRKGNRIKTNLFSHAMDAVKRNKESPVETNDNNTSTDKENTYVNRSRTYFNEVKESINQKVEEADIYIKGSVQPAISIKKLRLGEYYDLVTGDVITRIQDIKGTVVDKAGEVALSAEDLRLGVYNRLGLPVILSNVKSFTNRQSDLLNKFSIPKFTFSGTKKTALDYFTKPSTTPGKAVDSTKDISSTDKMLQDLYKLMNHRLPGGMDSHLKKKKMDDIDGDGVRDGSWLDRQRKRKASIMETLSKAKEKTTGGTSAKEKESSGMIGNLLGMLGLGSVTGGVGSLLGLGGSVASGAAAGAASRGLLGKLGQAGLSLGRGAIGLALNPVGTVLSGAKGGVKAGARLLPAAGKVAGRVALMGARMALPFMMNPIGLAILGGVALGYAAYKGYKYYKGKQELANNYLLKVRMAQYGVDDKDEKLVEKILMLEEMREKDFKRPGDPRPYDDPKTYEEIQKIFFTFGADPLNEVHQIRVADWYNNRGGPVMTLWSNALFTLKGYNSLKDIDKLNPLEKEELLKLVKISGDDPRSPINFPMIPIDGKEETAVTADKVQEIYDEASEVSKKVSKKHQVKLNTPETPSIRNKRGRRASALKEKEARDDIINKKFIEDMQGKGVLDAQPNYKGLAKPKDFAKDIALPFKAATNPEFKSPGGWIWPMRTGNVSSQFGMRKHPISGISKMHSGVDIAAPEGTPIYAPMDGEVTVLGNLKGYGNALYLKHPDNKVSRYGHLSGYATGLKLGAKVVKGQLIAYVGNTGISSGPHLHFEIRNGSDNSAVALNPFSVINDKKSNEEVQVIANKKSDAGKPPAGYGRNEGADAEGLDTIASTAKPESIKPPIMISRDYSTPNVNSPNKDTPTDTVISQKELNNLAYSDMIDINKEQVTGISRVGSAVEGMTAEQRMANASLKEISATLQATNKPLPRQRGFTRANSGLNNPTMNANGDTIKSIYQTAKANNLNPSDYLTSEQIRSLNPRELVTQTSMGRSKSINAYN